MNRFDEWMQECWNGELDQDLQEQAELAADIRREQEEADEDLRRELEDDLGDWDVEYEQMERDYGAANPWDAPGMSPRDFVRGIIYC